MRGSEVLVVRREQGDDQTVVFEEKFQVQWKKILAGEMGDGSVWDEFFLLSPSPTSVTRQLRGLADDQLQNARPGLRQLVQEAAARCAVAVTGSFEPLRRKHALQLLHATVRGLLSRPSAQAVALLTVRTPSAGGVTVAHLVSRIASVFCLGAAEPDSHIAGALLREMACCDRGCGAYLAGFFATAPSMLEIFGVELVRADATRFALPPADFALVCAVLIQHAASLHAPTHLLQPLQRLVHGWSAGTEPVAAALAHWLALAMLQEAQLPTSSSSAEDAPAKWGGSFRRLFAALSPPEFGPEADVQLREEYVLLALELALMVPDAQVLPWHDLLGNVLLLAGHVQRRPAHGRNAVRLALALRLLTLAAEDARVVEGLCAPRPTLCGARSADSQAAAVTGLCMAQLRLPWAARSPPLAALALGVLRRLAIHGVALRELREDEQNGARDWPPWAEEGDWEALWDRLTALLPVWALGERDAGEALSEAVALLAWTLLEAPEFMPPVEANRLLCALAEKAREPLRIAAEACSALRPELARRCLTLRDALSDVRGKLEGVDNLFVALDVAALARSTLRSDPALRRGVDDYLSLRESSRLLPDWILRALGDVCDITLASDLSCS